MGLTFIALANSDGLTAPFALESGDVTSRCSRRCSSDCSCLESESRHRSGDVCRAVAPRGVSVHTSTASADWLFMPFIGGAFAGSTAVPDLEQGASSTQIIFGGSAAWLARA